MFANVNLFGILDINFGCFILLVLNFDHWRVHNKNLFLSNVRSVNF